MFYLRLFSFSSLPAFYKKHGTLVKCTRIVNVLCMAYNLMKIKLGLLLVLAITISMAGNAYAHKSEVVGDYKIEVGWKDEPPIAGIENAIEVVVSHATEFDKAQSASEEHTHSHGDESMNMTSNEESMNMEGDMSNDKTAEQLHDEAVELEKQKKYAEAAELHHEAGNKLHDEAEDLENEGKYAEAAELHHEAADHHHMAAVDLEQIGEYADAAEHHDMAAEHHDMAAADLEKVGKSDEAQEHRDEAVEHKKLAELDREKSKEPHDTNMEHEDHESGEGISDLSNSLNVWVTIGDAKTKLSLVESTEFPGVYYAKYLPINSGFPVVDVHGTIKMTEVDVQMHPEEIEPLSTLPPLKQMKYGINPGDVECKEGLNLFMRTVDGSAVCIGPQLTERLMSLEIIDYF